LSCGRTLRDEFHGNATIRLLLLRYTQALVTQMAQTIVCNGHHSVDQQLCRWLLLRREGVTEAVGKLQRLGVISHSRGHITVLDRPALERPSCECYAVVKRETDRLLPCTAAWRGPACVRHRTDRGRHHQ
jgi:hypothetical protein